LFTLTYGAIVVQLLKDFDSVMDLPRSEGKGRGRERTLRDKGGKQKEWDKEWRGGSKFRQLRSRETEGRRVEGQRSGDVQWRLRREV
jgi:hypothetical protein